MVISAQEEARRLDSEYIGSEHLLLGLLNPELGEAARILLSHNVMTTRAEIAIKDVAGPGQGAPSGRIPFTPTAKKTLELALRESLQLGHNYIGPEHLLLGLLREADTVGYKTLIYLGADPEEIRSDVIETFNRGGSAATTDPRPGTTSKKPAQKSPAAGKKEGASGTGQIEEEREGIEAVPTHPDRPATQDELGRERLAAVIAERIRRGRNEDTETSVSSSIERRIKLWSDNRAGRDSGSFMVHVHAPWGAGKSSLLNFLARDLRNRGSWRVAGRLGRMLRHVLRPRAAARSNLSRWIVVEFSAWEHQRLAPPWWWLLAMVQRSCARELWRIDRGRWLCFWVCDIAWRLWNARVVAIAGLLLTAIAAAAWQLNWLGLPGAKLTTVQTALLMAVSAVTLASAIAEIVKGMSRTLAVGSAEGAVRFLKRAHDPLSVYRRRFHWLIRTSGRPLTVFIDDLDRCRPEYVVELLEGIQTLFVNEAVTYVVAADRTWLCESFACGYCDFKSAVGEPGRSLGFLFLEKTFQISMEIPPMSDIDQERYWERLMEDANHEGYVTEPDTDPSVFKEKFSGKSTQAEVEQTIRGLIQTGEHPEAVLAAGVRRLNAPELRDQQKSQLSEFAPLLEKNPRSMKRLMNAYGIERDRLLRDSYLLTRAERTQLALITILRLRWPELAEHLRRFPGDADYCLGRKPVLDSDHRYQSLFEDPELRRVFDGSRASAPLDPKFLVNFPGRPPS